MHIGTAILKDVKERYEGNPLKDTELTMRDHFAIAYMQSCVAGNAYFETFEGVAEEAYKMADAMLNERVKLQ